MSAILGTLMGLGSLVGLAGNIAGGIGSSKARKKQEQYLGEALEDARADYNRDYYQDITQRGDMMRLIRNYEDRMAEDVQGARQRQAVTGATDASVAAEKKAAQQGLSNAISGIASLGSQLKDKASSRWSADKAQYRAGMSGMEASKAQQWGNVMSNAANAMGGIASTALMMNPASGNGSAGATSVTGKPTDGASKTSFGVNLDMNDAYMRSLRGNGYKLW